MSLQDFKNNLEKIKKISENYNELNSEKNKIELEIRNLKSKYRENKVERDVFGEYNKKREQIEEELGKIRAKVLGLCFKNSSIIVEELKDVLG